MPNLVRQFASCRSGNFALAFALLIPLLLGLAGAAIDLMVFERQSAQMQEAADAAVLAATREASLKSWSQAEAQSVARAYVESKLADAGLSSSAVFNINTVVDNAARKVSLTIEMDQHHYFLLGYFKKSPQIRVSSTAKLSSETPVCMIALDPAAKKTVNISGQATLFADGCAAISNSTDKQGLFVENTAKLNSAFSCTSGGFGAGTAAFSPLPTTDCPPIADPLIDRTQPTVGSCNFTGFSVANTTVTINPGVYCNGMLIDKNAIVTMKPGVYIIKGGELGTKNGSSLTGDGVTIFFTGSDGRLMLDGTSIVNLKAPATGATAGLLMMQDRAMAQTEYEISSKLAAQLLGTIYLPNGNLKVKAPGKVADQSAFTVIVARTLEVSSTTKMYLNSNYSATNVPVPNGLGPSSREIGLVK